MGLTWGWHPSHQSLGLELHPLFPARAPAHLKGALVPSEQMPLLPGPIMHPLGDLITKKAPLWEPTRKGKTWTTWSKVPLPLG